MAREESICIIDWCGGGKNSGYWSDYFPYENVVKFGGEWWDIPDLIIDHQPTEDECREHISKYSK